LRSSAAASCFAACSLLVWSNRIEMSVIPVLLGIGIPVLPPPASRVMLKLRSQRVYTKTGTLGVEYEIVKSASGSRR
jgi:hypothetical protein